MQSKSIKDLNGILMNLKNLTVALIIALVYEMLLKLSHVLIILKLKMKMCRCHYTSLADKSNGLPLFYTFVLFDSPGKTVQVFISSLVTARMLDFDCVTG